MTSWSRSSASSNRIVEAMQVAAHAGPCIRCFETASVVSVPDVGHTAEEWSEFSRACRENDFRSVYAIPLRLRESTIGTLNLFSAAPGELAKRDAQAAQALADMTSIGILHERAWRAADTVRAQLQGALNSRIVFEQAKGVLAQTHGIPVDEAFARLRDYARRHQLPLSEVAKGLVDRTLIF